jgi:hypothetical protein
VTWIENAVEALRVHDAERPRSRQQAIGWSEVGGCRAQIGYRLSGTWTTDEPDTWAAQRGTAIHEYAGPILASAFPGYRTEVATSYRGIPGHADLVGPDDCTDLKTTSLANSQLWADDLSLLEPKRIQAHGYTAGLIDAGELPETATVRILVIPADGRFEDWWAYEEPFNRALADQGADRLAEVRHILDAGETPPKDKPLYFCESWCAFYSLCREDDGDDPADLPEITDPETAAAITAYGEANQQYSAAEARKKQLAPQIRGLRGITANGWRVTTSAPGAPKQVLDEDAIRADYEARDATLPMTTKDGPGPRLNVTKPKPKKARTPRTVKTSSEQKNPKAA